MVFILSSSNSRQKFGSRMGFILISAGCAIGLGNVWRFPYIVGQYGGGVFVLIYLFFLIFLGVPILAMEISVGRASQKSVIKAFSKLDPKEGKWDWFGILCMIANYIILMLYTTVAGWVVNYFIKMATGEFEDIHGDEAITIFNNMSSNPSECLVWMIIVVALGFLICSLGMSGGMETITKFMMVAMFALMFVLILRAMLLPGALSGISFFLNFNVDKISQINIFEIIYAAMGQAFFTLSIGSGVMTAFGSYIGKERRLLKESMIIGSLDTLVSIMVGLIIFPCCFSFNVNPDSGPKLIFVTLAKVFSTIPGGRIWGSLFFLFLSFAAISTVIALSENLICMNMDTFNFTRKKSIIINLILIILLSIPTTLSSNLLSFIHPLGEGSTIMDLEDFIITYNILPFGAFIYIIFCTSKFGWGWENFLLETNSGIGSKFPKWARLYVSYIIPLLIIYIFIQGYISKFFL